MVLAAAVGLSIAAAWREDSRLPVGIITVAACIGWLTCKLAADKLALREVEGRVANRWAWVRIVSVSAAIAVAVIGASDGAFLVVYRGYMLGVFILAGVDHFQPQFEPEHIVMGALLGGIAALRMASLTSRLIRTPTAKGMAARSCSCELESAGVANHGGRGL